VLRTLAPAPQHLESLRREVEIDYTHRKGAGARLKIARVRLRFTPGSTDRGVRFQSEIPLNALPSYAAGGVEHGVYAVSQLGLFAGGKVVGVTATLLAADHRGGDANPILLAVAAALAFRRAGVDGEAAAVEPVMRLEVTVQSTVAPLVVAAIKARRGRILTVEERKDLGWSLIEALAPHATLIDFFPTLRALTGGRCDARMTLAGYEPTPDQPEPVGTGPSGPDIFPPAVGMRA
jgi:elongation factor G